MKHNLKITAIMINNQTGIMKEHLDITLDLETASLSSHAAIMQIAAVAWDRFTEDVDHLFLTKPGCDSVRQIDDTEHFCVGVELNSQFVEGLWDFSQSTSEWWSKQSAAAKMAVVGPEKMSLNEALIELDEWINNLMEQYGCRSVSVWCQGTDFDIPILRYAAENCGLDRKCKPISLHHKFFNDCRTVINACVCAWLGQRLLEKPYSRFDILEDPLLAYKILPELPESFGTRENAHGALYDCIRSSWFTWQALDLIR